jgi:D-glycero-alpha-D-manno-heptose 1-phosphate guanylyltransferase
MSGRPLQVVAVVLAGGLGTRIKHLVPGLPKPMVPVAGRPFLEWVVRYLIKQGIRKVIISSGYRAETIERHFQNSMIQNVAITCAAENTPLGTGGGLRHVARVSGERPDAWLVLNGDTLAFADLGKVISALDTPEQAGVIVGREVSDTSRYGTMVVGSAGELLGFAEKRPGKGVINAGIYLLKDSVVVEFPNRVPLSLETDVFPQLVERKILFKVCVVDTPFLDIGTPESLQRAQSFVEANRARFAE